VLVGRDVVLRASVAALDEAVAGRGRLVVLAGEAGIGKTTVAREIADRAAEAGAEVRWGACWEGETLLPFAVWLDCLRRPGGDACAAAAERLEVGAVEVAADVAAAARAPYRFFGEVIDALREVSSHRPQVLVLEDVHWADTRSLELLRAATGHLPSMAVLAVADVLGDVLGRAPSVGEAHAVHEWTGGNPLFVTQVGRLLAAGSPDALPAGVREVLARRLARLSSSCDRVLGAAAVLGTEFDVVTLSEVIDEPVGAFLVTLDEAAAARLAGPVDGRPERWAFAHGLVQAVRYEALGSAERDAFVDQLTKAFGLGRRARSAGADPDERLRKAVSARVKSAIDRIERLHPALGRHLRNSVRTGFWCSYEPERPVRWSLSFGDRSA
jgi:predicted ATPase